MEFRRKRRDTLTMDITPLVDVVFLLLIFFMLSTTFIVEPGIRIDLPKANADMVKRGKSDVRVKVDKEGLFFLEKIKVTGQELEERLKEVARVDSGALVVIEADEVSQHQYVVEVMDRARSAGLARMAIATKPRTK